MSMLQINALPIPETDTLAILPLSRPLLTAVLGHPVSVMAVEKQADPMGVLSILLQVEATTEAARHTETLTLTPRELLTTLGLPDDITGLAYWESVGTGQVTLICEGPGFPPTKIGARLPEIIPEYTLEHQMNRVLLREATGSDITYWEPLTPPDAPLRPWSDLFDAMMFPTTRFPGLSEPEVRDELTRFIPVSEHRRRNYNAFTIPQAGVIPYHLPQVRARLALGFRLMLDATLKHKPMLALFHQPVVDVALWLLQDSATRTKITQVAPGLMGAGVLTALLNAYPDIWPTTGYTTRDRKLLARMSAGKPCTPQCRLGCHPTQEQPQENPHAPLP